MSTTITTTPVTPTSTNHRPLRRIGRAARWAGAGALALTVIGGVSSARPATAASGVRIYSGSSWMLLAPERGGITPGTRLVQLGAETGTTGVDRWLVPVKGSSGPIVNTNSGLCVSTDGVAGHALYLDTCIGVGRQRWENIPANILSFDYGYSAFRNTKYGLYFDVNGNSYSSGAPIIGWSVPHPSWGLPANEAFLMF